MVGFFVVGGFFGCCGVFLFVYFFLSMDVQIIGFFHPISASLSEFWGFPGRTHSHHQVLSPCKIPSAGEI